MKEISFTDIGNVKVGHAEDHENATGCTVLIFEEGAPAGVDVRGGGPASRETELLNPVASCKELHAIFLSGGSAFGLDATGGVMKYLEEHNIGYQTMFGLVPLVCTSCIFDLGIGSSKVRPDQQMAYTACVNAQTSSIEQGNIGAGTGATVGKYRGLAYSMKTGLGIYAVQIGDLKIGAVMVVNAIGDVYKDGKILAGMLNEEKSGFANTENAMFADCTSPKDLLNTNTTIGAVVTNANFDKNQLTKIAAMSQNGMARAIAPVHTLADGDSIYALSVGTVEADVNAVGTLAARIVGKAILNAVTFAKPAYNLPNYNSLFSK